MKNFDETRRALVMADWTRRDRTVGLVHRQIWKRRGDPLSYTYLEACALMGIEPVPIPERVDPVNKTQRKKLFQTKNVKDKIFVDFIRAYGAAGTMQGTPWTPTWDILDRFDYLPPKIVMAKLRSLVRRGKIKGHPCFMKPPYCRGDFEVI